MALKKRQYYHGDTTITAENLNEIQDAVIELEKGHGDHTGDHKNPHQTTAEQVGARPNTWMPTAEDVGAHPNTWVPTASQVGARPDTWLPTLTDIGAAPAGHGLGAEQPTPVGDLNEAIENGVYNFADAALNRPPFGAGEVVHVISYGKGIKCQMAYLSYYYKTVWYRWMHAGTWGEWECSNPPMTLGVEYRTTERYLGKPVYAMLFDVGELPANSSKTIYHNIANVARPVNITLTNAGGTLNNHPWFTDVRLATTTIYIGTNNDNAPALKDAYAYLKYTKTTD